MPDGNLNTMFSSCFDEPERAGRVQPRRCKAAATNQNVPDECNLGVAKLLL